MKREWLTYAAAMLAVGVLLVGCGEIRKLSKSNPEVGVKQPKSSGSKFRERDTLPTQQIITFKRQDGTEMVFTPVTVDSLTGEKLMTVGIEEVVISASSRRNLVERNGKINVDFIVTVPQDFLNKNWRMVVDPRMQKGPDTLSLEPLVFSGENYRAMQRREYQRYDEYLSRIVDSADYFDRFGNKKAYGRYLTMVARKRGDYADVYRRLDAMTPEQARMDKRLGWMTPRQERRMIANLRSYVRQTDGKTERFVTYKPIPDSPFDHLNDYLTPRYRYQSGETLPGGEIYTRVNGKYVDGTDLKREAYYNALAVSSQNVRRQVNAADKAGVTRMTEERMAFTGDRPALAEHILLELSDSATRSNYNIRKQFAADQVAVLGEVDTLGLRQGMLRKGLVDRNNRLVAESDVAFARRVPHPYVSNARLDTIIYRPDGKIDFHYTEEVPSDENTSKLYLFLNSRVEDTKDRRYLVQKSDTLTYNVASMTSFLDESPRYMQRIVLRDAEANARFNFTFPSGKTELIDTLRENREQIAAVRDLTRKLMTDPIYIIDSITLRATASPEGAWATNERLAHDRAEALRRILIADFRKMYDSLRISATVTLDEQGRQVYVKGNADDLPNLPNILLTNSLAEDWGELARLIREDAQMPNKDDILGMMDAGNNPDHRELLIRNKYPKGYEYMRRVIYPQMRAVDFRFNLHRRGMQQDTVYTTEIDSSYMHAVELLKKRRYEDALKILRPYEDRNTALAYMSLGYDAAAFRILQADPNAENTADLQYMMAILSSRLGDEVQAVQYFLRAVELRGNLKFRGNLDPEISRLIRKYGLFKEDFE